MYNSVRGSGDKGRSWGLIRQGLGVVRGVTGLGGCIEHLKHIVAVRARQILLTPGSRQNEGNGFQQDRELFGMVAPRTREILAWVGSVLSVPEWKGQTYSVRKLFHPECQESPEVVRKRPRCRLGHPHPQIINGCVFLNVHIREWKSKSCRIVFPTCFPVAWHHRLSFSLPSLLSLLSLCFYF